MGRYNDLWKILNEERVDEDFMNPIPKEFKDTLNKSIDKLKDISDGISKSIGYLNRVKRDLTGKESINDIEEKKQKIIDNLSEYTKLDFGSVPGILDEECLDEMSQEGYQKRKKIEDLISEIQALKSMRSRHQLGSDKEKKISKEITDKENELDKIVDMSKYREYLQCSSRVSRLYKIAERTEQQDKELQNEIADKARLENELFEVR